MKTIPDETKIRYDGALFQKLKDKNLTGEQRKQALGIISTLYQLLKSR
jgi:cytoplasmic iron level regulating protein YaaA (DUF328/UPF0246 family)